MADVDVLASLVETRARTEARFDTFISRGPDKPTRNYVVIHFDGGTPLFPTRLSGGQSDLGWGFRIVCVGLHASANCLYVAKLVRSLFLNWYPVPSEGFTSWFIEENDGSSVLPEDEIPGDLRYSLSLRYTLTTNRS